MKAAKLAKTTESASTTTDTVVDVHTTSGICCINVSGGTGTGTVTVRGVLQSPSSRFSKTAETTQGTNYLVGSDFTDLTQYYDIFDRADIIASSTDSMNFTESTTCYQLSGHTGASQPIFAGDPVNNAICTVKDASTIIASIYVKQFDIEAESASGLQFGIYEAESPVEVHQMDIQWNTYGGTPTTSTPDTISFSGIEDAGNGWWRVWVGLNGVSGNNVEGDKCTIIIYLDDSNSAAGWQERSLFVAAPMVEQFEKGTRTVPSTYSENDFTYPVVTFPTLWSQTISPDTNYKQTIPMYPKFRVTVDNSSFGADQIDVDLGHN